MITRIKSGPRPKTLQGKRRPSALTPVPKLKPNAVQALRTDPSAAGPETVLQLQRLVGNRATAQTLTAAIHHTLQRAYEAASYDAEAQTTTDQERADKLREIVWEKHWAAISAVCKKHKYTIAVRETGEYSIKRIAEGAKPKPHTILEKSIKPDSIKKKYGDKDGQVKGNPKAILETLISLDLDGFVGHWNDEAGLIGVRIDNPPQQVLDLNIVKTGAKGEKYVPIDLTKKDGGAALATLKKDKDWKHYLYTGDYDLHEVYAALGGSGGGQIAEASLEKIKLLNRLNQGIAENVDEEVTRSGKVTKEHGKLHMEAGSDYAMFQHGDQATYRMNQQLEAQAEAAKAEKEAETIVAKLVRAVATESDEPMAWCRFGEWYVTMNRKEHQVLRDQWHLAKPHTWGADEDQRTAQGGYKTAKYEASAQIKPVVPEPVKHPFLHKGTGTGGNPEMLKEAAE